MPSIKSKSDRIKEIAGAFEDTNLKLDSVSADSISQFGLHFISSMDLGNAQGVDPDAYREAMLVDPMANPDTTCIAISTVAKFALRKFELFEESRRRKDSRQNRREHVGLKPEEFSYIAQHLLMNCHMLGTSPPFYLCTLIGKLLGAANPLKMYGKDSKQPSKRMRALELLASGMASTEVARQVKLPTGTLANWMKDKKFQRELEYFRSWQKQEGK